MSEQKKLALITGASRGIGQAILAELAKRDNVIVIGTATSESGAQKITDFIQAQGYHGQGMVLNVSSAESISQLFAAIKENYAQMPDILVNNAAITKDNLMMRMKDDEWHDVISTNLTAVYHMSKACLRDMMKKRWGRIINVSSISAFFGNPGQANYAAAKAGVGGMTRSLAAELGSRGVTCNAVAPGFVDTDMTRALPEEYRQKLCDNIPLGRVGKPEEIAAVVAFLASDIAGYITGETIHVNGGMYMH
ncbi:MAG: 3-oxoacyl-ACP reductase [Legionellales bacterium]|nr:3-oxoacyl-ACP reductase [Legionellales bacterium]|tara:strand:- start:280 stop:1029 length:750 start_codon:yes stop_codon:yes gene_type:complete